MNTAPNSRPCSPHIFGNQASPPYTFLADVTETVYMNDLPISQPIPFYSYDKAFECTQHQNNQKFVLSNCSAFGKVRKKRYLAMQANTTSVVAKALQDAFYNLPWPSNMPGQSMVPALDRGRPKGSTDKRPRSPGSGRPKGSKDKQPRKPRGDLLSIIKDTIDACKDFDRINNDFSGGGQHANVAADDLKQFEPAEHALSDRNNEEKFESNIRNVGYKKVRFAATTTIIP